MENEEEQFEKIVRRRVANVKATATGVTAGLLSGISLSVATIWLVLKGGENVGQHLGLLSQYFIGYTVSIPGSFIGFLYAFVVGFVIAFSIARIYNFIVDLKHHD